MEPGWHVLHSMARNKRCRINKNAGLDSQSLASPIVLHRQKGKGSWKEGCPKTVLDPQKETTHRHSKHNLLRL